MTILMQHLYEIWGVPAGGVLFRDTPVGRICTDSRKVKRGDFFVPLIGDRFDGHCFLNQLPQLGIQAAVVSFGWQGSLPADLLYWRVDNTLHAYQQLAYLHRKSLDIPIVAVTGSAGKTTTRELISAALAPLGNIQSSVNNNNNDVGVPLTMLDANDSHQAMVIEMGMRGPGEIARLSQCVEPNIAVITNIGRAHIGLLGSVEAIAAAKCEITTALNPKGVVVIPSGMKLLETALNSVWNGRVLRVSLEDDILADVDLVGRYEGDYIVINGVTFALPLQGRHNSINFLLAIAVAREFGVELERLTNLRVEIPGGRNRKLRQGGITILDETYNASPESVFAALNLLADQPGRHFAVLGKMLELGKYSIELHREVALRAAQLELDGLVLVIGEPELSVMFKAIKDIVPVEIVSTPEAALQPLCKWLMPGDVLLLKASNSIGLERLLPLLPRV